MSIMEISLLVLGIIIFVASFVIPERKSGSDSEGYELSDALIRKMIDKQMNETKKRLEGVVDETLEYAVEKTERAAERISNEKIMAVNEYSDTVLEEINKNHKEVMFLYDMLNSKHKNITNAAMEVDKKARSAEETAREAEEKVLEVKKQAQVVSEKLSGSGMSENMEETVHTGTQKTVGAQKQEKIPAKPMSAIDILRSRQKQAADNMIEALGAKRIERPANLPPKGQTVESHTLVSAVLEQNSVTRAETAEMSPTQAVRDALAQQSAIPKQPVKAAGKANSGKDTFVPLEAKPLTGQEHILEQYVASAKRQNQNEVQEMAEEEKKRNNNDKILSLHKQGKSKVAIAKELGLGVGEVSLVLNLYKGA